MPLLFVAFVCGAWLLQWQPELPALSWAWGVIPLFFAGAVAVERPAWLAVMGKAVLCAAFFSAGFFWAAWLAQLRLADALPADWEGRNVELVGVVAGLPQQRDYGLRFDLDVEAVKTAGAHVPRRIGLTWYNEAGDGGPRVAPVRAGERWQLRVRLRRPHGSANPHGFDYEAWLLERNIRAVGYVRAEGDNRRTDALAESFAYRVQHWREGFRERFRAARADAPYAGVLIALAIGDQQAIPQDQWKVFTRTGVNHLMSISGLHVTMVAGLAFFLAAWLWTRSARLTLAVPARKVGALAGAAAALGYALMAGFAVPTQRTVFMLAAVALALWLGRLSAPFHVLAIALFLVTLADPWAVLAPGFWLSFGAVALIFYVSVGRTGKPTLVRGWWRTQWAVTLGLTPPLLALFQQVSLVSPVANAVAIPVVSLVVVPITLLGAVIPWDGLLWIAHQVMAGCMAFLVWLSELPDAVWEQHAPPPWTVAVALLGVAWLLLPKGFPSRWIGAAGLAPMFLVLPPAPGPGEAWLTVLDVGQGLSVVARTHRHALLYDTGPGFAADANSGNRIIVPFLRGEGVRRLDLLVLSHDDTDHHGGTVSVLQALPVETVISSLAPLHPLLGDVAMADPCYAGQEWDWDGVRFTVLHPAVESFANPRIRDNDRSCVLKISVGAASVLLTGDIERRGEAELLARARGELRATVLVVPHHGGKSSSGREFVEAVSPRAAVFTAGYRNPFGHPRPEVVARYRGVGAEVYRSDRDGAVILTADATGIRVQSFRDRRRRYWQERPEP
ncbi:MAG: DNA internalization-related competence protein ComEC/Rec2 [Betaproteobacteria bacterium]|nr:DNA internalization-related competence protein ComEC/Rec2 [Betaproteobacteria bacterium]